MKVIKYSALLILLPVLFSGCKNRKTKIPDMPAQELYDKGMAAYNEKDFKTSSEYFGAVFFQNPGSEITASSEVMNAYTLFKQGSYDEAIDTIDVFMKLRPKNEYTSYMHYLKALCYYVQIESIKLEQLKTETALKELELIIEQYPDSDYAKDARIKKQLVLSHLAGKEMEIGRYYLDKKNPIAAIARFQGVVKSYDKSVHIEEAYYRLIETNLMLGLNGEADYYYKVLSSKYPQSKWNGYAQRILNK